MSQLPSDFEKIVIIAQQFYESEHKTANAAIRYAVERCYALHSKPPKLLTRDELETLMGAHGYSATTLGIEFVRAIEAAVHVKQRELEAVKFRAARHSKSGTLGVLKDLYEDWEWLEPPQEFEVKV